MSRAIDAEYGQCFLLPPSLEEWVGPAHPARFVRDFVDGLELDWLGSGSGETAEAGRPHYAPRLLLCLWLYGYMERIRSPRALERACRNHMGFIWLSGMLTPDHNTLWRFWKAYKGGLKDVFRQSVKVAAALELVEMVVHCVDSTKITSAASKRRALSGRSRGLARLVGRAVNVVYGDRGRGGNAGGERGRILASGRTSRCRGPQSQDRRDPGAPR